MKIAVIGSGAREHAIAYKLNLAKSVEKIIAIPGSDAMAKTLAKVELAQMPKGENAYEILALELAKQNVDYVVVGPEKPLVEGLADILNEHGVRVFGPSKMAAQLEGSKEFAKEFMKRHNIPTAKYQSFTDANEAIAYINEQGAPIVVKADGLAAGKGVVVAKTIEEAIEAVKAILIDNEFSCGKIVIEEFLEGEEVTLLNFSDGINFEPMIASQDHKRIYDGDKGPNTGGMGAYAPARILTDELREEVIKTIVKPTIDGMKYDGMPFIGCLYAGLILTNDGPKVIEYNARFGDPETQVILPLLESDFGLIVKACCEGTLAEQEIKWSKKTAACIVCASENYPKTPVLGRVIEGNLAEGENLVVFHAGTKYDEAQEAYITSGGRVLGVTAWGDSLPEALEEAYARVGEIKFKGLQYRLDIGKKDLSI